jgi:hypothetical protein
MCPTEKSARLEAVLGPVYEATKAECLMLIKAHKDGVQLGVDIDPWRRLLADNERRRLQYIPGYKPLPQR